MCPIITGFVLFILGGKPKLKGSKKRARFDAKWEMMEKGSSSTQLAETGIIPNKYHIPTTYKGKNRRTRTQWRRFHRNKKAAREAATKFVSQ